MRIIYDSWLKSLRGCLAVNAKDGSVLLHVPAGEFEMGDGHDADCPKHTVHLDEYWIGVYCVTNRQYAQFVKETGHRAPDLSDFSSAPPVWRRGECPPDRLDHPVVCVSWDDAQAYTKWADSILPAEAQWEKAARGRLGLIYPWGLGWDEDLCRNDRNKGERRASEAWGYSQTSEVWGYGRGASGHGTYQQSGNAWEWCADWHEGEYYGKSTHSNPTGPDGGSYRVIRGGCWRLAGPSDFRGARRGRLLPSYCDGDRSFRIARSIS